MNTIDKTAKVQERAYYLSLQREEPDPEKDWLEAEREIEASEKTEEGPTPASQFIPDVSDSKGQDFLTKTF
jgi:DUF2934 family protein